MVGYISHSFSRAWVRSGFEKSGNLTRGTQLYPLGDMKKTCLATFNIQTVDLIQVRKTSGIYSRMIESLESVFLSIKDLLNPRIVLWFDFSK
jgi:hypothetical protein